MFCYGFRHTKVTRTTLALPPAPGPPQLPGLFSVWVTEGNNPSSSPTNPHHGSMARTVQMCARRPGRPPWTTSAGCLATLWRGNCSRYKRIQGLLSRTHLLAELRLACLLLALQIGAKMFRHSSNPLIGGHICSPQVRKENKELEVSVTGLVSNANYSVKKGTYIFFINSKLLLSFLSHPFHKDCLPSEPRTLGAECTLGLSTVCRCSLNAISQPSAAKSLKR